MPEYPYVLAPESLSAPVRTLIHDVASRLVGGSSPGHELLREQLKGARLSAVRFTGVGLFADFICSPKSQALHLREAIGGQVPLTVAGVEGGAGSLLIVEGGFISTIEIYTYGDASWPEQPEILSIGPGDPIVLADSAI